MNFEIINPDAFGARPSGWNHGMLAEQGGGTAENIGRMVCYITDRPAYLASFTPLGKVHRKHMGRHYPAMAVVEVKSLVDSKALVEIEAVAVL